MAKSGEKTINNTNNNVEDKATECTSSVDAGSKDNIHEAAVTTNTFYEPAILPNYGGDLYQHINVKLHQLDIRDVNNELIAPQD
jgi:hypothetical protein